MKKLFIALLLVLGVELAAPPAAWAGDNAFQRQEPKGAHSKGKRKSSRNKHEQANGRRAREQAAAAKRAAKAKNKSALRRQQAARLNKAKQQGRHGR